MFPLRSIGAASLLFTLFAVSLSEAQPANSFFEKNGARDVFGDSLKQKDGVSFEFFPIVQELPPDEDDKPKKKKHAKKNEEEFEDLEEEDSPKESASIPSSPEEIIEAYGEPDKDAPVVAQDNAPKPFKGMMAAFQSGDEDLAYRYARQWVRYVRGVNDRSTEVMAMTRMAMEGEGMIEEAPAEAERYRHVMEKNLKDRKILDENAEYMASLKGRAREMVEEAQAAEGVSVLPPKDSKIPGEAPLDPAQQEALAREEVRKAFTGKLPVDPKGEIDVLFFVSFTDPKASAMGPVVEALYQSGRLRGRTSVLGYSVDGGTSMEADKFKRKAGITFELVNGKSFSAQLKLVQTPAVVFMSRNTGKLFIDYGVQPLFRLEEILRIMQGGK